MNRKHQGIAEIDKDGEIRYYGLNQKENWQKENKNSRMIFTYYALPENGKEKMLMHIKTVVIPGFEKAYQDLGYYYNTDKVKNEIRKICSFTRSTRDFNELSYEELWIAIMELKDIAASEYGFNINEPGDL